MFFQFVVVKVRIEEIKGRKAIVSGRIEDLKGTVLVEQMRCWPSWVRPKVGWTAELIPTDMLHTS